MAQEPKKDDEARRQKQDFFAKKIDEFVLSTAQAPDRTLQRVKEPVLYFTNPVRDGQADGAIFLWHSEERPAALGCLRIRKDGAVWHEFTSFSDQPLRCERNGKSMWAPKSSGFVAKPVPDAPKPADTSALRLAQMRRLAERFSGDLEMQATQNREELRMMPQPLHRYTAEKGTVEGAVFALAQANDPEILLMVELAQPKDAPPRWSYTVARMSSQKLRIHLDKKEVWTADAYWSNPRVPEDPYVEGPDGKYPPAPTPVPKKN